MRQLANWRRKIHVGILVKGAPAGIRDRAILSGPGGSKVYRPRCRDLVRADNQRMFGLCARSDGRPMPEIINDNGKILVLNGTGVGMKFFARVYDIGLYLESKTTDAQTAITSNEAKRIAIVMLRNVSRHQFVEAVEKGMVRNSGVPIANLRSRLDL